MKYSWKVDDLDTEIFGFKVAKIIDIRSQKVIKDLITELINNKVRYATYRAEANNFSLIQALQRSDFLLVDGIISLEANLSEKNLENPAPEIREGKENDLDGFKRITSGLYVLSRIYNDPLVSRDTADNFFAKWIENSIYGKAADSVLVWEEKGEMLGYVTLQKKGQIPLIGVSKNAQGRGIAKKLLKASFNKFKEWKVDKVIIETQITNIPALRVDQDCGFKVINSYLTFRWANA